MLLSVVKPDRRLVSADVGAISGAISGWSEGGHHSRRLTDILATRREAHEPKHGG